MPVYEFECPCGLVSDYFVKSYGIDTTECDSCGGTSAVRTNTPNRISVVVKDSTPYALRSPADTAGEIDRRVGEDAERRWAASDERAVDRSSAVNSVSAADLEYRKKIQGIMRREVDNPASDRGKDDPPIVVGKRAPRKSDG